MDISPDFTTLWSTWFKTAPLPRPTSSSDPRVPVSTKYGRIPCARPERTRSRRPANNSHVTFVGATLSYRNIPRKRDTAQRRASGAHDNISVSSRRAEKAQAGISHFMPRGEPIMPTIVAGPPEFKQLAVRSFVAPWSHIIGPFWSSGSGYILRMPHLHETS